jgi:hypothetical protein
MGGMTHFEELDLDAGTRVETSAEKLVAASKRARLVLVHSQTDAAGSCGFWSEMLGNAGFERVAVDEDAGTGRHLDNLWSNVEFDPERQNRFRYSRSPQPLHTDGSYVPDSPPLVVMFCERPATEGGATLFLDGDELIHLLANERGRLLAGLSETPMVFQKGDRRVTSTVIARDSHGPLLRWNYYALSNQLDAHARTLADEFQAFVLDVTRRSIPLALRLERGDAVLFHDYRLLHGREGFAARAAGDRLLWKGGLRF